MGILQNFIEDILKNHKLIKPVKESELKDQFVQKTSAIQQIELKEICDSAIMEWPRFQID